MSIKELKTEVSRSFYLFLTIFVKLLLCVSVPFTKNKHHRNQTTKNKSDIDLPPPLLNKPESKLYWKQIIDIRQKNGIKVKPIKHRSKIPQTLKCPTCYAPKDFIYSNGSTYLCSLCGRQVNKKTKKIKPKKSLSLFCPFCFSNLQQKKERSFFIVYKCINPNCPYKLKNKIRYSWRLFTINDRLPIQNTTKSLKLTRAHSHIHIIATSLYLGINLSLASTDVKDALNNLFKLSLSHKTIDNYKYAAANLLYNYFFSSKIFLPHTIIIDETYISIRGKTYYLYTAIDDQTRQVLSFYLSDKRNGNAAFNLLQLLVARASNKTAKCLIITDGAPFYIPAICFANLILGTNFSHQIIIGLKSKHPLRPLKNKIERFYSTFNDSFKSHHGFKSFYAALAHSTLFFCYYNLFRPHLSLNNSTPVKIDNIKPNDNAIKKWLSLLSIASSSPPPITYVAQIK